MQENKAVTGFLKNKNIPSRTKRALTPFPLTPFPLFPGEVADINLIDNHFFREFTDTIPLTEETAELPDMQGSRKMLGFLPSPATYSDGTKIAQLSDKQIVK